MLSAGATEPRILLDESSFDFRGLADRQIEQHLDDLNRCLSDLRSQVACPPMWDGVACLEDCELFQFLSRERRSDVDRDTLLLTYTLLSRCPEWQPLPNAATSVAIDGEEPRMALSVAHALGLAMNRRGAACLIFPGVSHRGFLFVRNARAEERIFFFCESAALPIFWRHMFTFEDVPEHLFFEMAVRAFPNIILHADLSFRRFDGAYGDLRDRVVEILAGICDHFTAEYKRCRGLPNNIQAAMGSRRVYVSPESPKTRGSQALMRQRDVVHAGSTFRCEWHAKLERHRNRIHFAKPSPALGDKILVGIFTEHLDT